MGHPAQPELSFLVTHFGTAVIFSSDFERLEHSLCTFHFDAVMILTEGEVASFVRGRTQNLIYGLLDAKEHLTFNNTNFVSFCNVEMIALENNAYAFRREGLYLSSDPSGTVAFVSREVNDWERFRLLRFNEFLRRPWEPARSSGGTEIVAAALRKFLGSSLDQIQLGINHFDFKQRDGRPVVIWIHNEVSKNYDWLRNKTNTDQVSVFVFVSEWQRQSFTDHFGLPVNRCVVLRNAIAIDGSRPIRTLRADPWRIRCAYTSAPYRGLEVLLDAWELISPPNAELHIWSSRRLWGPNWKDDEWEEGLFRRARSLSNVHYHGMAANAVIRAALEEMDVLAYSSTFLETSCLSIIEAMAAGLRVVAPSLGVIPETTAGFGRLYPYVADKGVHAKLFASILFDEICNLWSGNKDLLIAQQAYVHALYSWETRKKEWLNLLGRLS